MTRLLGIDMGTTTFKAVVYDETGETLAQASIRPPEETLTVRGVAVETWPAAGVWESICSLTRDVATQLEGEPIKALAVAELGLVGVPLYESGRAHESFVTWIDPAVTRDAVADFPVDDPTLFSITGNRCSSIYPPVWIRWLSEHLAGYAAGMQRWLNVGDYIVYRLCGEAAIDYSMASQTLCLDQRRLALRGDLLAAFGLPKTIFPAPGTAGTPLGTLSCTAADDTGLQEGTLVVLGGADFVTGVYGAGVTSPGDTAILTGTWENVVSCLRMPELSSPLERAGAICDAHVIPGRWSLRIENLVGDVTEWYRAELGSLHSPTAGEDPAFWDLLSQEARESVPGAGGVVLVPHLFGSYGPRYDELARGTLVGLTNRTTRKEIARALFEGLCFQSRHTFEGLVQASGLKTERLVFMGGAAKNALWTQTRANVMGRAAEVVLAPDVTPRGAAMVAGVGAGVFAGFEEAANAMVPKTEMIEPDETLRELYDELFTSVYLPTVEAVAPINHSLARLGRFTASGDQAASQPLRTSEASP